MFCVLVVIGLCGCGSNISKSSCSKEQNLEFIADIPYRGIYKLKVDTSEYILVRWDQSVAICKHK